MFGAATQHIGLGAASMAGYGIMGSMASVPGFPAQGASVIPIAGAGLQLANVGRLAKTGLSIPKMFQTSSKKKLFKF